VEKLDAVQIATNTLVDLSMHSVFVNIILFITHLLTVVTQKNAVDLHSMSIQSLNTHHYGRGKTIRPVKNTGLYQWMTFVPLVAIRCFTYNKHKSHNDAQF